MAQATQEQKRTDKPTNRPIHTVRYGTIQAAIWRNMVDNGNASRSMYSVTFSRSYKESERWKDSSSFGVDDLLTLAKAANDAHTHIYELRRQEAANDGQN
jgi:hypothetical protein